MKTVDVLVIGTGPAGAAAAEKAAAGGLRVLAVDRREEIGLPVQCAEFIPLPMGSYARADGVLYQTISGMKSILPSGERTSTAFPGLMIDRAAFDQELAARARRAGAELMLRTRLTALDLQKKTAVLRTVDSDTVCTWRALVAADGPHSTVAALSGLPELATVHTRQYTVDLNRPYADTDIWLSNDYPGGYAWLFPKGNLANLGLGLDKAHAADLKQPLDSLHAQLVREGLVGERVLSRTGGAIPVGGLREHLAMGDVLFTGDAAGLTHPITGAGIPAAVISGERAGEACVHLLRDGDASAMQDYEEDMRDQFEVALDRAVERRRWMAELWNTDRAEFDAMHRRGWIAFPEYFAE